MNTYKRAIEKSEVISFFRGLGEYYDLDRERGVHNITTTTYNIFGIRNELGEKNLYNQLNSDLNIFVDTDNFDKNDVIIILNIFWTYFLFKLEEQKLKEDWIIDIKIINKLKMNINKLNSEGNNMDNVSNIISRLKERFNFDI